MATSAGTIPISATFNSSSLERDVLSALNRIQSKSSLKLNAKGFIEPLGRISGLGDEFQKSLEASNARVIAFGASAGIIYNIQKAFGALVTSTIETEKALISINSVLNASSTSLNKFGNELFNIAKLTGNSFSEVATAATEFSRQGLSLEETLKRTRDALILTRLSGLDVVSSTEALTAAVNSFSKEALNTTDVVNKLAAVDAKFAVSSRDLSEAIKRVGSSASEAGVSFDELLGVVTSVQQTTARGGAVIGNALKTIFTRIQRPEVLNDLRQFGVAVEDSAGKTLPVIKVLQNLASSFENLNPVVKAQVGELVGGVFQINILKASLSDLSKENNIFAAATKASTLALDDAIEKNKAYNSSISALLNSTLVNFQQLGKNIGAVSIAPGIEKIIGTLNTALEDINAKDSQSVGAKIGKGLLKGVTDFVTGPGLAIGVVILSKLFSRFGSFTIDATKNLLGLNTISQQQETTQKEIAKILSANPALLERMLSSEKERLAVEREIRSVLIDQSTITNQIQEASKSLGTRFVSGGLAVSKEGYFSRKSEGYIPNFDNQFVNEVTSAKKLGASSSVKAQLSRGTIDGKKFILNNNEIEIPNVGKGANQGDSAVIPKYGGGIEKAARMLASGATGSILKSTGHIPNFASRRIAKNSGSTVEITDDGVLDVAYLSSESGNPLPEILSAIKEGSIKKINAGFVVGPKVPSLIVALKELLPRLRQKRDDKGNLKFNIPKSIPIYGYMDPQSLFEDSVKFAARKEKNLEFDEDSFQRINEFLSTKYLDNKKTQPFGIKKKSPGEYAIVAKKKNKKSGLITEVESDFIDRNSDLYLSNPFYPTEWNIKPLEKYIPDLKTKIVTSRSPDALKYKDIKGVRKSLEAMGALSYSRQQGEPRKRIYNVSDKRSTGSPFVYFTDLYPNGLSKGYTPDIFPDGYVPSTAVAASSGSKVYLSDDGTLKVSMLSSETGNPLLEIQNLIQEGKVKKIDAGPVIGPRVPNLIVGLQRLLKRLRNEKNENGDLKYPLIPKSIPIQGFFRPASLLDKGQRQSQYDESFWTGTNKNYRFTPKDLSKLKAAMRDMGAMSSSKDPEGNEKFEFATDFDVVSNPVKSDPFVYFNKLFPNGLSKGYAPDIFPDGSMPQWHRPSMSQNTSVAQNSGSEISLSPDGTLKIGFLSSAQGNPLVEIQSLLEQGKIKKIDAGGIIGPKVPNIIVGLQKFLKRLRNQKNADGSPKYPLVPKSIPIVGYFDPARLLERGSFFNSSNSWLPLSSQVTPKDLSKLKSSLQDMGVLSYSKDSEGNEKPIFSKDFDLPYYPSQNPKVYLDRLYPNGLSEGFVPNFVESIAQNTGSRLDVDSEGVLKVGFLSAERGNPLPEIQEYIQKGKIKRINAGQIIGPKVPNIIVGLKRLLPLLRQRKDKSGNLKYPLIPSKIPITGYFNPKSLVEASIRRRSKMVNDFYFDDESLKRINEKLSDTDPNKSFKRYGPNEYRVFDKLYDLNGNVTEKAYATGTTRLKGGGLIPNSYRIFSDEDAINFTDNYGIKVSIGNKKRRDTRSTFSSSGKDIKKLREALEEMGVLHYNLTPGQPRRRVYALDKSDYSGGNVRLEDIYPDGLSEGFIPNFSYDWRRIAANSGSHLSLVDGTLHVGILSSASGNPLPEIQKYIQEGAIKRIDAGTIIGPKVPNIIVGLKKLLPLLRQRKDKNGNLKYPNIPNKIPISGYFNPKQLSEKAALLRARMIDDFSFDDESLKRINEELYDKNMNLSIKKDKSNTYRVYRKQYDQNNKLVDKIEEERYVSLFGGRYIRNPFVIRSVEDAINFEEDSGIKVSLNNKKKRDTSIYSYSGKDLTKLRQAFEEMGVLRYSRVAGQPRSRIYGGGLPTSSYGEVELEDIYPDGLSKGFVPNFAERVAGRSGSDVQIYKSPSGKRILKINFLRSTLGNPLFDIEERTKRGEYDVLNAGTIIGPKVPNIIVGLERSLKIWRNQKNPDGSLKYPNIPSKIPILGSFSPDELFMGAVQHRGGMLMSLNQEYFNKIKKHFQSDYVKRKSDFEEKGWGLYELKQSASDFQRDSFRVQKFALDNKGYRDLKRAISDSMLPFSPFVTADILPDYPNDAVIKSDSGRLDRKRQTGSYATSSKDFRRLKNALVKMNVLSFENVPGGSKRRVYNPENTNAVSEFFGNETDLEKVYPNGISKGYVPNFAKIGISQFKEYLRSFPEGLAFFNSDPNIGKINWYRENPDKVKQLRKFLADFNKKNNSNYVPSQLSIFDDQLSRGIEEAAKSNLPAGVIEQIRTEKNINALDILNNPRVRPSLNAAVLIDVLASGKNFKKQFRQLESTLKDKPLDEQNRIKVQLTKMKADFGAEYERYAIGNLRKIGYPNIVDADSLGLYGQASSRGGQNQTSVDAVDLDSQSFFEMKSGDIPTGNINKKFRNVRTDEGNFELLFKKKFKKSWAEAATPEELSQGKIWKTNPSAFDELFKKRSGFGWTNVLVGSDYNQAAKSGNKFIYLNPSGKKGPYMGMKETFQSLKQVKTFNSPETIPTSDIVNLLRSESERVVGKIGYPAKSKGFIPNFSEEQQETFEAPGTARIPLVSQMVGRFFTNVTTPVNYDLESKAKQLYETGLFGSLYSFITDTPSDEVKSGYKKGTYVADRGATEAREPVYRWMYGLEPQTDWQKFYVKNPDNTVSFNRETPEGKNLFNRAVLNAVKAKLEGDPTAHRHSVMSNYGYKIEDDKLKFFDRWDFDTHPGEQGLFDFFSSSKPSGDLSNPNSAYNQVNKDVTSGSFTGRLKNTIRAGMSSVTEPVNITGEIPLSELPKLLKEAGVLYKYKDKKGKTISEYPFLKDSNLINKLTSSNSSPLSAKFSKGHVPNFNSALKESIAREVSAGYSPSQVRVGFSKSLVTDFNPTGAGVYNTSEGSLPAAMQLAKNAGVNPKTKGMGMAFNGHVPNFAELDTFDVTAVGLALVGLLTQLKSLSSGFKDVNASSKELVKQKRSEAGAISKSIGETRKKINERYRGINPITLEPNNPSGLINVIPQPGQRARVATGAEKEALARARESIAQRRQQISDLYRETQNAQAPLFSARSLLNKEGKLNQLVRTAGPGAGLAVSAGLNIAGQFLKEDQFTGKAITSGFSDIAQFAGVGAAFGPLGVAGGALVGLGLAAKKFVDAGAEEALYKINKQLEITKNKSNDFANASQGYIGSLEQLQSSLNDPNARPESLIKFQTSIRDALNEIPDEFRQKVLNAGSDITRVSDAIAKINKELNKSQEALQAQSDILTLLSKNKTLLGFGESFIKTKDQEVFNRLFTRNINQNELTKQFKTQENFQKFIDDINSNLFGTQFTNRIKTQGRLVINEQNLPQVKKQLEQEGIFSGEIASAFEEAAKTTNVENINKLVQAIQKVGIEAFKTEETTRLLVAIQKQNVEKNQQNAKEIKRLNDVYNSLNIQISDQISIERNRAKTIREINQIQAEGQISTQRARLKGALDQFSPFISEQQKLNIETELNLNEIVFKQNSQIRDALNKTLESFTETIVKQAEELRSTYFSEVNDVNKNEADITAQRNVFQQNLQRLTPVIQGSISEINAGGNVNEIQKKLANAIRTQLNLKPEAADILISKLNEGLKSLEDQLALIKAQGDIDKQIQLAQIEYQRKSLELNQRLSFAGGAQALASTGKTGVSELYDNISDLVSEFRRAGAVGTVSERGSAAFKLLDVLTNQLQLNRSVTTTIPFKDAQSFNNQVSSDLTALTSTAIAGRVDQIRKSLDLARNLTEIELGKTTKGTALGKAFDQANQGAVQTALDQVVSQFKLENMGTYLDILQKEARYLNTLTSRQNQILETLLPKSLNDNFKTVIQTEVGSRLQTLTNALTNTVNTLARTTKEQVTQSEIRGLLPITTSNKRDEILNQLKDFFKKNPNFSAESFRESQSSSAKSPAAPAASIRSNTPSQSLQVQKSFDEIEKEKETIAKVLESRNKVRLTRTPVKTRSGTSDVKETTQQGKPLENISFEVSQYLGDQRVRNMSLDYVPTTPEILAANQKKAIEDATQLQRDTYIEYGNLTDKQLSEKLSTLLIESRQVGPPPPTTSSATTASSTNAQSPSPKPVQDPNEKLRTLLANFNKDLGEQQQISEENAAQILERLKEQRTADRAINAASLIPPPPREINRQSNISAQSINNNEPSNIPDYITNARAASARIDSTLMIQSSYNENLAKITEEVNSLLNDNVVSEEKKAKLLQKQIELRNNLLNQENKNAEYLYKLYYNTPYGDKFFRDERAAQANVLIESEARQGRVAAGAILRSGTAYNQADFAKDSGETLKIFVADFKSGVGGAFSEAIKGVKNLRQAFADFFESLLNRLTDRAVNQLVDVAFGAAEKGFSTYAGKKGSKGGLMTPSGFIRGYNSGGLVTGGSGIRDDIPTMMNGGEFVIRKSSVNKYGEGFLSQLNQGMIPTKAAGGSFTLGPLQNEFVYNDPERPTSGEYQIDPRLSAFALTDEDNPQNKLREDRFQQLDRYLIDRAQFERDKQKALSDYEAKVKGVFTQGLITAGAQLASAGAQIGVNRIGSPSVAGTTTPSATPIPRGPSTRYYRRTDLIPPIDANYSGGGSIGKDNIPALLMGGEYVMSQQAVRNYGTNFMNQLNNGSLPRFANGGLVPNSNGSITTSTRNDTQNYSNNEALQALLTAINSLNDTISQDNNISRSESGIVNNTQGNTSQAGGMSVVNNISVNVTPSETTSSVETNTQNNNPNSTNQNNDVQNSARLGELLKNKIVEVIAEQKRPGGLLYSSR